MITSMFVLLVIGLVAGVCLAVATRFFHIEKDKRIEEVASCLSGANCGACGYTGCISLAAAVVQGKVSANACPGADATAVEKIAMIIGEKPPEHVDKKAVVLCSGGKKALDKYEYSGIRDCTAMSILMGGIKNCSFGCLGGGSCARVCPKNAIKMGENGLPDISAELCVGCGLCVPECPRGIIILKDARESVLVLCSSHDKGAETRKICSSGCIGCGMCAKVCSANAIAVHNFLAMIDFKSCTSCGECAKNCPVSAISLRRLTHE